MKEITLDATIDNIAVVTDFVEEELDRICCPMRAKVQINVAIDELFGNIAHYAYAPSVGQATVRIENTQDPPAVVITFTDSGVPYDPLQNEDPDITLQAEERAIGGLGIFMVKKTMTDMRYTYQDGKNILTITKNF